VNQRVLILSWEFPPIVEGGLARHVHKLTEALLAHDVEVHVLTRGDRATAGSQEERDDGVVVHRVAEPPFPKGDLDGFVAWVQGMNRDMLAAGAKLAERHSFDLVHSHDWLVAEAAHGLAETIGVPWITTIHATESGRHQGWVDKHPQSYIHGVERWMAQTADRVITCSAYMRGHVADVFGLPPERVTVIANGIDPTDLQAVDDLDALRAQFAEPDEKLILLIGRLVYEKGFQLALDALPAVIARHGRVRFVVAGTGTHEEELKAQAERLGLGPYGTFVGWLGDEALHSLYRIADVCVVPSIYEPFGLVALEAMASGCPCIVADTGGLREVVPNSDVGLRFRARDPASLARMVNRVLGDEALAERLALEAQEHVLKFDWADVARQTVGVYSAVLARAANADADAALLEQQH